MRPPSLVIDARDDPVYTTTLECFTLKIQDFTMLVFPSEELKHVQGNCTMYSAAQECQMSIIPMTQGSVMQGSVNEPKYFTSFSHASTRHSRSPLAHLGMRKAEQTSIMEEQDAWAPCYPRLSLNAYDRWDVDVRLSQPSQG